MNLRVPSVSSKRETVPVMAQDGTNSAAAGVSLRSETCLSATVDTSRQAIPGSPSVARNRSLDAVRFAAAVAVVTIHVFPAPARALWLREFVDQAARFAVPFFFAASGYLFAAGIERGRVPRQQLGRSVSRLLYLYIVWSAIYFFAGAPVRLLQRGLVVEYNTRIQTLRASFETLLLVGPAIHLWFFPALVSALLLVFVLRGFRRPALSLAVTVPLYVIGVCASSYAVTPFGLQLPVHTRNGPFLSALCVSLGGATRVWRLEGRSLAIPLLLLGTLMHFTEISVLNRAYGLGVIGQDYVLGTVLMGWGALLLAISRPRWLERSSLSRFGPLALGIYLIHPLIAAVVLQLTPADSSVSMILAPVIVLLTSLLLVKLSIRLNLGKRLLA